MTIKDPFPYSNAARYIAEREPTVKRVTKQNETKGERIVTADTEISYEIYCKWAQSFV